MSVSQTAFLRENASKYSDKNSLMVACIEATGKSRKLVSTALSEIQQSLHPIHIGGGISELPVSKPLETQTHFGISELELRQKHDLKYIISRAAQKLEKGTFITENEFIKQCNISNQIGFRQTLADAEFSTYKGKASGITYWSNPESITKMKNEGILR